MSETVGSTTVVLIAGTMWAMVSLAFILNSLHAPRWLIRIPLGILATEFVLSIVATYRDDPGASYTLGVYVLPGAAVAAALYTVAYGLRRHRRAQS
jgi:hypothetical protein